MNATEYMDIFNEIENDFPVDKWKINNVHIWPHLRLQIWGAIRNKEYAENYDLNKLATDKNSIISKGIRFWNKVLFFSRKLVMKLSKLIKKPIIIKSYNSVWKKVNTTKSELLFLSVSSTRTFLIDKWFNTQFDPFLAHLENSDITGLVLELDNGVGFRKPIFFDANYVNLDKYIDGYFLKNKAGISADNDIQLENYDEFISFIKKKFNLFELDGVINIDKLTQRIIIIQLLSGLFKQIIENTGTKMCFITDFGTIIGMALCHICHELNIPSVDLQHGIQGDLHRAYGRWFNVPEEGYSTLPSIFWNWNKEQKLAIDNWATGTSTKHRSILGGNPWFGMWKEEKNKLSQYYTREINRIKNNDAHAVHILYTMQPSFSDTLSERVIEAYYNSPSNWRWWFRLHPRQIKKSSKIIQHIHEKLEIQKSDIKLTSELPLPVILKNTDIHITQFSSVVLDAEFFNVPSVITHPLGASIYKHQIEKRIAAYSDEKNNDLIACIKQQLKYNLTSVDQVDTFNKFDILLNEYGIS